MKKQIFRKLTLPALTPFLLIFLFLAGCGTALTKAASKGLTEEVLALLDNGADINEKTPFCYSFGPKFHSDALTCAAYEGQKDTVKLLLERGADVNATDSTQKSYTALVWAACVGHVETIKLLVEHGADVGKAESILRGMPALEKLACVSDPVGLLAKTAKAYQYGQSPNSKGWFGIEVKDSTNSTPPGAEVGNIIKDGPADHAGILPGDILVSVNGKRVVKSIQFANVIQTFPPGTTIAVKLVRSGVEKELPVTLSSLNQRQIAQNAMSKTEQPIASPVIRSDVDELPGLKGTGNKHAYAIVIGIEQYRQNLPKADYATQDAKLVADYLIKSIGYAEENVVTLTNDRAALGDFVKYFEKWLPNNVEPDSTVFVYFSGHGAPNTKTGDAYIVPYDGDPSFIDETGYSLNRMYGALGKLPAKEIVVALDSCFSGAGGRSVLAEGARPLVMNLQISAVLPPNVTVLSASAGEQTSSTYKEKGHGLFTYFLLKGIKNEEVVGQDGSLDVAALYDYVKPQVTSVARKKYNNEQTPQLLGAKP